MNRLIEKALKSDKLKPVIESMQIAAAELRAFAITYLGEYNEKGEQLRKGDRDYIFEYLEVIKQRLDSIEKRLDELRNSK